MRKIYVALLLAGIAPLALACTQPGTTKSGIPGTAEQPHNMPTTSGGAILPGGGSSRTEIRDRTPYTPPGSYSTSGTTPTGAVAVSPGSVPTGDPWFDAMDASKDGMISRAEHQSYLDTIFIRIDRNGDGVLSYEEVQVYRNQQARY